MSTMEQRLTMEQRKSFLIAFAKSKGPPQIIALVVFFSIGYGATAGIVPGLMSERYARLNYGYNGTAPCSSYPPASQPEACVDGNNESQRILTYSNLVGNLIAFLTGSMVGSISDEFGRRGMLILGMSLSVFVPLAILAIEMDPRVSPNWYYIAFSASSLVNWNTVAVSALADVLPPEWRAPGFGMLQAGFLLGVSIAPMLTIIMSQHNVAVASLGMTFGGLLITIFGFPETLSPDEAAHARSIRQAEYQQQQTGWKRTVWVLLRPFRELSILNRTWMFRLLTGLAFCSGIVTLSDQTLLLYYVQSQYSFTANDIAGLFVIAGTSGVIIQSIILKPLNDLMGERLVLVSAFFVGAITNFMYGIAPNGATIYVAIAFAGFGMMAFPAISAIKANNVGGFDQGRVQGALYAVQALAYAIGPLLLRAVYRHTFMGTLFGQGSMFVTAALLLMTASAMSCGLPSDKANSMSRSRVVRPDDGGGDYTPILAEANLDKMAHRSDDDDDNGNGKEEGKEEVKEEAKEQDSYSSYSNGDGSESSGLSDLEFTEDGMPIV